MSEGMFLGRKFTIPYDNSTDKQVASMARAQMITRTATPGTVIQVGDTVMAYGVTPQEAKMGDLDVRLRSFEQISNQAQEAVRRNIQWQYGEQVGEADPMKKAWGWFSKLVGMPGLAKPFAELEEPVTPQAPPAAAPKAAAPKSQPAKAPVPAAAPAPAPAAAPKKRAAKKPAAPEAAPQAAPQPAPAAAPKSKAAPGAKATVPFGQGVPAQAQAELLTAFQTLQRRHRGGREASLWTMSAEHSGPSAVSIATHKTGQTERHEVRYNPETKGFTHLFTPAGSKKPVETHLDSADALHSHVLSDNDSWVF